MQKVLMVLLKPKVIMYIVIGVLAFLGFRTFFNREKTFGESVSDSVNANQQTGDVVDNLMNQLDSMGHRFTLNKIQMIDRASDIASALGTLKGNTSWFEDEGQALRLMIDLTVGEFGVIEYIYKHRFTDDRDLQVDIKDLMPIYMTRQLERLFVL